MHDEQAIIARADLQAVLDGGELPAETQARLQHVVDELVYERVVLNREGHPPPFELTVFDIRQIVAAVERLPGARSPAPRA